MRTILKISALVLLVPSFVFAYNYTETYTGTEVWIVEDYGNTNVNGTYEPSTPAWNSFVWKKNGASWYIWRCAGDQNYWCIDPSTATQNQASYYTTTGASNDITAINYVDSNGTAPAGTITLYEEQGGGATASTSMASTTLDYMHGDIEYVLLWILFFSSLSGIGAAYHAFHV